MPASVIVPRLGFFGEGGIYKGLFGGLLGTKYDSFNLEEPGNNRNVTDFRRNFDSGPLTMQAGLSESRIASRRQLLDDLQQTNGPRLVTPGSQQLLESYDKAYAMLSSNATGRAFDLGREPQHIRERYGWNEYGQSFLLARRLVEAGVRTTTVLWFYYGKDGCKSNVWDTHGGTGCVGGVSGFAMMKANYLCPPFDRAYSALLQDLHDRGLLDETLVVAVGEFGRTPKVNKAGGRDHWGPCYSALLSGGGIQGGCVYGASDKHAAYVTENPVTPDDLSATIYQAFGLPPETEVYDHFGRPIHISDGSPVLDLFAS